MLSDSFPNGIGQCFILIPVHNRRFLTLKCLNHLATQADLDLFQILVIDDGSTDGTSQAIKKQYPQVQVLKGDGGLWWTGAMELGMKYAYDRGAEYFVWLNDDTLPAAGAISALIALCTRRPRCIVAGQCYSDDGIDQPTYGGFCHGWLKHSAIAAKPNQLQVCDSVNGNLVCLPRSVVSDIGYPPAKKAPHYHGETIYTWRAKQEGYTLLLSGDITARCAKNPGNPSWLRADTSIVELWQQFRSPKSPFYMSGFWHFCMALWGPLGMLIFVQPYGRLGIISLIKWIVPKAWLRQV